MHGLQQHRQGSSGCCREEASQGILMEGLKVGGAGHMEKQAKGYIGRSVLRREDDYLLRGKGQFVDDMPVLSGQVFLGFVMSPHAHATIRSIDATAALALPGVIAVLTAEDVSTVSALKIGRAHV